MRVLAVRHDAEDGPFFIGEAFEARGAELISHLFPDDGPLPPLEEIDHIVVLGSASSVNDAGPEVPWIEQELDWLRRADAAGIPALGICFGAQALCVALGGRVEPIGHTEAGWHLVDSVDTALIPAGPWLESHEDRCLPPPEATILATNETGVQAYSIGRHLAVQFHAEVVYEEQFMAHLDHLREWAVRVGLDLDSFVAETIAELPASRARADVLVATALRLAGSVPADDLA